MIPIPLAVVRVRFGCVKRLARDGDAYSSALRDATWKTLGDDFLGGQKPGIYRDLLACSSLHSLASLRFE